MAVERRLGAWIARAIAVLAIPLALFSMRFGGALTFSLGQVVEGLLALCGLGEPLPGMQQAIFEFHCWRVLTICGVGASLALSGVLLQGVFRNALAAPSIIGVTGGASLGAAIAIFALGGYAGTGPVVDLLVRGPITVSLAAFVGGLATALLVMALSSSGGRFSVPMLVLTGLAVNACVGGALAGLHSLALDRDWEIARALFSWGFGHFEDKEGLHVAAVSVGVLIGVLVIPFLHRELDLLAGGDHDARALGVPVLRVRLLALATAALAAALTVAVAGQIGFIGLVVPHMLRAVIGAGHRRLLWTSMPAGAVFLLLCELVRMNWFRDTGLRPGAMMAMIGGPTFVILLLTTRRSLRSW